MELLAQVLEQLDVLAQDLDDSTSAEYLAGAGWVRLIHRHVAAHAARLGLLPSAEVLDDASQWWWRS